MKRFLFAASTLCFFACNNSGGKTNSADSHVMNAANFTTIKWKDSVQDVGTLNDGAVAQIHFHFTNTGEKPLLILSATPGCGCTVADYTKEPIDKGKEGEIVAAFDTKKAHPGHFMKSITVASNTKPNGNDILTFSGEIKSKDSAQEPVPVPVETPKKN